MSTVYRRYIGPVARQATRLDGREHVLERGDVVEVSEEQAEALDRTTVADEDTGEVVFAMWEEADASDYAAQQEPDEPDDGDDSEDGEPPKGADDDQDGEDEGPPGFDTVTVDERQPDDDEETDQ